ncbi:MAG: extracellular solute-binding protein [Candidatus Omnitrophota bacterium]|nr:extracellular solute-binding protein [Candidatus Omnitrophota bacterium]
MILRRLFRSSVSLSLALPLLFSAIACSSKTTAKQKTTITVWHWMTDRQAAFEELSRRYFQQSGVRVNFELYAPSDTYSQKVRAAAQGQNLPDIFGVLGEKKDFASFVKAGHILDLTPYMEENNAAWKDSFFAKALAVNEFSAGNTYGVKPGIYGTPIDIMAIQMLYNKALIKELGFDPNRPPQAFADFIDIGKKAKEKNIQPFVSGWGELWLIDCFANNYAFNIMGKDKVLATIRAEVPYTDPDWIQVLSLFQQLREAGVLSTNLITMENKTAERLFANGKAHFAFNGSWCVNVYQRMNPQLDYAAMLVPKASDKFPMSIWGGAGSSLMANARSKNKEEAVRFLKWLTGRGQQAYLAESTNNLPANKESMGKVSDVLASFSEALDSATHPNVWGISEFPLVIEAWDKGIQSIIIGEKAPQQVAQEVQKIKERELAKRR